MPDETDAPTPAPGAAIALPPWPRVSAVPDPEGDPAACHRARLTGLAWPEAATTAGYPDELTARLGVIAWRSRTTIAADDSDRAALVQLELERLDALQLAWWNRATSTYTDDDGLLSLMDDKAAGVILKIIAQRAKLLGLEDLTAGASTTVQSIVVNGDSQEFVASLKRVIEG